MDRFSKENINRLVKVPQRGLVHTFREIAGPVIDFSGFIGATIIILLQIIFNLPTLILLFAFLGLIIQLVFLYFIVVKFNKIKINKYRIDLNLKKELSFVFVSDLHIGSEYTSTKINRLKKIILKINELKPDLVLIGGDLLTYKIEPNLLEELKNIKSKNIFAVYGNHDADYLEENVAYNTPIEFLNAFRKSGIKMLLNQYDEVEINGKLLTIAGIPDLYSKNFNIEKAFEGSSNNSIRVLLSHNPDVIDFIEEDDNIDLVLSGHNHSGQIFLPLIGPVFPMPTKRRWLTRGIFQINKRTKLFLSQGVGYSGSRLRINTDSEICLITLY